jgi:two-component system CheB/CheR fusion protein
MTTADQPGTQLVVIGASAGGVEALSTLVSTLPTSFPAPIVVAQHLDPRRASHLGEILQRRSPLPVRTVQEREPLEAGVIYVVPANRDIELTDHAVSVRIPSSSGPRPSIDLLMRSAAQVFGEGLLAVILTGTGSDGAAGAREVKEAGGTVVIQNPATASYPAMPLSLAPTTVDIIANLENIGPLLRELLISDGRALSPADERPLRALLDELRERSGIDFSSYKMPTIQRRLQRRMAATGAENLGDYVRLLQRNPEEYQRLVAAFLIKVTQYFRDPDLFDYLRAEVVPALIAEARRRGNELRIWSAGCATGEEPYSLAILVSEALGDELDRFTVRIFATDLDGEAVAFARRGIYPAAAVEDLPREQALRHFVQVDSDVEVRKRLRSMVVFGQHDLSQRAPFPRIDLALCRNVLIYFTPELQRRALQLFAFSLREGGVLVLGKAESTAPLAEHFAIEQPQLKVYRRHGDPVLIPPARIRDAAPSRPPSLIPAHAQQAAVAPSLPRMSREAPRGRGPADRSSEVLTELPIGVVVVDRRYDVQSINIAARRLLGIYGAAIGEDLVHLARDLPSQPLRALIDAAFTAEAAETVEDTLAADTVDGATRSLHLICQQRRLEGSSQPSGLVSILVADITAAVGERRHIEALLARTQAELASQQTAAERLAASNRQLLAANEEMAKANADLRAANEEFLVANEEVQAAIEESETLNEELQATNEELETLNEELQATVEELNTTNDDLQARSLELQEMTVSLEAQRQSSEAERSRLLAILSSMEDALVVVDADGRTLQTNEAYDALTAATDGLIRPEDGAGRPLPDESHPQRRAARGEAFRMEIVLPTDAGGRRYEVIGRPFTLDSRVRGGVLVFRALATDTAPDS